MTKSPIQKYIMLYGTKSATPPLFLSVSPSVTLSSLSSNKHPWEGRPPGNHGYRA